MDSVQPSHLLPILMVDDEQEILHSSAIILKKAFPNEIITIHQSDKVLPFLEKREAAAIVLDLFMPGIGGKELLSRITYAFPQIPIIVMTAANSIEMAVECMKRGAFDYLIKPVERSCLLTSLSRAIEVRQLRTEVHSLKQSLLDDSLEHREVFASIVSCSRKMRRLFQYLESVAGSNEPVLICGETGVGKELFAKALHELSARKGEFVAINIGGLDDLMFSDTLFGHRKGAFSGADQHREGFIARAANGTLILDEVGDLGIASQIKLLRLLQENEYFPLGSDVAKRSSARIVAATNRDLSAMISAGTFRNDLYYRLCCHCLNIPPLRDRPEDIPLLLDHFLSKAAASMGKSIPPYPKILPALLASYQFPGNIREFKSMAHDAVARHTAGTLSLNSFKERIGLHTAPDVLELDDSKVEVSCIPHVVFNNFPTLKEAEEYLVSQAMKIADQNQGVAASLLGLTRQALNNRLIRKRKRS